MLDALSGMLGGDGRSRRLVVVPAAVLAATVLAFMVIGTVTAAPLYVSIPNGLVIAMVMAGLTVACMMSPADDCPPDHPPRDDDTPVLGSPGGPWTVVAHLGPAAPGDSSRTVEVTTAV